MGNWDWRNDRRLHAALGLAIILLAAKVMFTDTWTESVKVVSGSTKVVESVDVDGNVKAIPVSVFTDGWLPMLLDLAYGVLVFIGGKFLAGALMGADLIRSTVTGKPNAPPAVEPASLDVTTDDFREYIKATKVNDADSVNQYRIKIRKPDACRELNQACIEGDFVKGDAIYAELKQLFDVSPVPAKQKRGSNG